MPLLAADDSAPEPDLSIVPRRDDSREHPSEALLVIDVALRSSREDRLVKAPLHAASGVREYRIVNVAERVVEAHRGPSNGAWTSIVHEGAGATPTVEAFPDAQVRVSDILG